MIYSGIPSFRRPFTSEVIEPLDPADAAAIAEGVIALDNARFVDEIDTDTDLDSERIVLLDDRDSTEADSVVDPENDLDLYGTTDASDQ